MRQLAWRASHPEHNGQDSAQILNEGMRELEVVREENKQMRAAHAHLTKRIADNAALLQREADLVVGGRLVCVPAKPPASCAALCARAPAAAQQRRIAARRADNGRRGRSYAR